jgi:hypothetical protein
VSDLVARIEGREPDLTTPTVTPTLVVRASTSAFRP